MAIEVVIPMLGVTVENGRIVEWLKKEGDPVEKGESIFVVEADKVTTEVEAPAAGILARILLKPGEDVPVLTVVGLIAAPDELLSPEYVQEGGKLDTAHLGTPKNNDQRSGEMLSASSAPSYDLVVIGGGPGGYVAAICGARSGLKTALIEKDALGGTCLNRGCIPTKSLVNDTGLFRKAVKSSLFTGNETLRIQAQEMFKRKRKVVQTLVDGVTGLVKSNGVVLYNGIGMVEGPGKVQIQEMGGGVAEIATANIILANGSRPAVPSFIEIDGERVQTTDEILDDFVLPGSIAIIGGGVIGIEMATIFNNIGAQVTVIEMLEDILLTEDKDIRKVMATQLKKRGVEILTNTSVREVTVEGKHVRVSYQEKSAVESGSVSVEKVLVSTGRRPDLTGLDVARLGLECQGSFIKVNENMETNLSGVYAIGDLIGGMMLAHKASAEAEAAVEHIKGASGKAVDPHRIPRCIWGALEVGAVGMSETEAAATGRKVKIGRFPFAASGAAQAKGHPEGLVKIIGDADTGEILGVHIIGEHATDMIAEAVTVMQMEGAVEDLYEAVKPHPTLSEAVLEAALDWNSLAIHLPRK
ncbi:MAG: dihydrolipoyl dehydrogenase [Desulfopila sp.]